MKSTKGEKSIPPMAGSRCRMGASKGSVSTRSRFAIGCDGGIFIHDAKTAPRMTSV